jgi:hypothetical protein
VKGCDGEEEEDVDAAAALPRAGRPWERQSCIAAVASEACIAAAPRSHHHGDRINFVLAQQRFLLNPTSVQGVFLPSKISGVGTIFGLLVHVLPGPNEQRELQPSMLLC